MQNDTTLPLSFSTNSTVQKQTGNVSTFVWLNEARNIFHWQKPFEIIIAGFPTFTSA